MTVLEASPNSAQGRDIETASAAHGERLVDWARSHGAQVSRSVAFLEPHPSGDRVCKARADIAEDEVLLELPRNLAFEISAGGGSGPKGIPQNLLEALRPKASESGHFPAGKSLVVALLLHFEHSRGTDSHVVPYLESLPSAFPTMPLTDQQPPWSRMSDAVVQEVDGIECADEPWMYKGTGVDLLARGGLALSGPEGIARMRHLIDELDPGRKFWPSRVDDRSLQWAAAAVQSRAHATQAGGTMLIPLADAFNHSPSQPNCEVVEEETILKVRALENIASGQELLISYGHFSNAELVFNAGFSCDKNEHDCLLMSPPGLVATARQRWRCHGRPPPADLDERMKVLFGSAPPPRLSASAPLLGRGIPSKAVTLLAGLALDEEQWSRIVADDGGAGSVHELWAGGTAEAARLRGEVLACVGLALRGAVAPRYAATSPEADREALVRAESALEVAEKLAGSGADVASHGKLVGLQRRVNILRVRVGERNLLAKLDGAISARAVGGAPDVSSTVAAAAKRIGTVEDSPTAKRIRLDAFQDPGRT